MELTSKRTEHFQWPALIRVFAPAFVLLLATWTYNAKFYLHYFPFEDDPAVFHGSLETPAHWFTQGFSHYFLVYPEWAVPFTDFLRPGVNSIIRLEHLAFGLHYYLYFVLFYAVQLAICAVAVFIADIFGLSGLWLTVVATLTALSPAFFSLGLFDVADHFDVWCGLLCLLALYLVLRHSYLLATIALLGAVLTKEAALYAPIAACASVYLQTRRKLASAGMLFPLVLWFCLRKFVFNGSVGGLYALPLTSARALLLGSVKGVLSWPIGTINFDALKQIRLEHSVSGHLFDVLTVLLNVLFWLLLGVALARLAKSVARAKWTGEEQQARVVLAIWLLGALSFGVLAGHDRRFGGSIYPLEVLFCTVFLYQTMHRRGRTIYAAVLTILAIAFLVSAKRTFQDQNTNSLDQMRTLAAAVSEHSKDAKTIYVLNSASSYSAPSSLAALTATSANLVVLSQFEGCTRAEDGSSVFQSGGDDSSLHIISRLPSCAHFVFDSVPSRTLVTAIGGKLRRGQMASYSLPAGLVLGRGLRDSSDVSLDYGKLLNLDLATSNEKGRVRSDSFIVLYYDWTDGTYHCYGASCLQHPGRS